MVKLQLFSSTHLRAYTDPMGATEIIWKNGIMWNGQKNSTSAPVEGKHFKQIFLNNLLRCVHMLSNTEAHQLALEVS